MDNEQIVVNWQRSIINICMTILSRPLSNNETAFIQAHGGFLALEAIEEHVRSLNDDPVALIRYLNAEADNEHP
ncbi:hypothetical protein ABHF91_09445 [Pseudaeromonas sp. ZJS20]|uniref:hypothetical protein n=1 Tax=Pseudaeromonas aegiceratis TaxID=3153928 RepID=UPI00390CC7B5